MVKINYSIVAVVGIAILVIAAIGFVVYGNAFDRPDGGPEKARMTVTDMAGRTVTLNAPVERIVIMESSKTAELAAIAGDGFAEKIVGWDSDFKRYAGDEYAVFVEKCPQLADIPEVGLLDDNTFSIEKTISLKPDVVIMQNWQLLRAKEATTDALNKLERAGIPVVFLDFYTDPMANSTKSMLLLGEILGKEDRAQEIVNFYNEQTELVYSRLAAVNGTRPSVYIECGINGPSSYANTYGDVAWGSVVKRVGGNNIAESLLAGTTKAISPEYLVSQNPDIIILTGRNWATPDSLKLGYTVTQDTARNTMTGFVQRPGWDTTNAVKNHKVYGIYQGYCYSIYNFAVVEAFAKWFYPEEFKDVDPDAVLREYHDRFMPIDYNGTFFYSYY
ncbi:ferrichrome/ferrioxamine B periplasmic transporter [Methanoculleus chikugoensis]|uniref:Ferrichrome/ferrioxamine B periplasmic transporter n=1 Tax=Methanoculleus chikugoensis TaxID=118126 RepID=A0A1M4MHP6_9EURY|nr:ABC transporter substrate-binding protein [Methanoculleus chikugoensis]SCL74372.1 ferrichrome/ferrioxamine B periplasmic transporter [Methanoculleus chikugoensis]